MKKSQELSDNYWIYRVYDLVTENPKVYCVHGDVQESFSLQPYVYKAQLK